MKTYCIVNADNGEIDYANVPADSLENALVTFSKVMPKEIYRFTWMFGKIGDTPYIFTDNGTRITGYECFAMPKDPKKYEVIADHEWIYEGDYDSALKIAESYWSDPDFWGACSLISEDEFYGYEE